MAGLHGWCLVCHPAQYLRKEMDSSWLLVCNAYFLDRPWVVQILKTLSCHQRKTVATLQVVTFRKSSEEMRPYLTKNYIPCYYCICAWLQTAPFHPLQSSKGLNLLLRAQHQQLPPNTSIPSHCSPWRPRYGWTHPPVAGSPPRRPSPAHPRRSARHRRRPGGRVRRQRRKGACGRGAGRRTRLGRMGKC